MKRGEVYWVYLDSAYSGEIRKTRPVLVVSPDDMNHTLPRVIVAPLSSKGQPLGCRPELRFQGRRVRLLLDQIRAVDKSSLGDRIGSISLDHWHSVLLGMLA